MLTHTREELQADYLRLISRTGDEPGVLTIDHYSEDLIVARTSFVGSGLRPEGMIAGPSLFMVVDTMGYLVTISRAPRGSNGFTTAVAMQFLRSAPMGSLRIEGRLLRYSKRSAVVDTLVFSDSVDEPVAQAVVTYVPVLAGD
jgi:acyl-coenzyme A thioesterase PaaI-like protein